MHHIPMAAYARMDLISLCAASVFEANNINKNLSERTC
jgi:hypothetical protein